MLRQKGCPRTPPSYVLGDHTEGPSLARWRRYSVSVTRIEEALRHLCLEILHVVPVRLGHHPVSVRKCRESSHRQHPVEVFPLSRPGSVARGVTKYVTKGVTKGVTESVTTRCYKRIYKRVTNSVS